MAGTSRCNTIHLNDGGYSLNDVDDGDRWITLFHINTQKKVVKSQYIIRILSAWLEIIHSGTQTSPELN